jgi:hypothetical protein
MCITRVQRAWHNEFLTSPGFILPLLRFLFSGLHYLSPHKCFTKHIKCEKIRYMHVDAYETIWFIILILFLVSSGCFYQSCWFIWIASFFVAYRLFDIFQSWVYQFILMKGWSSVDVNRSLVLVFFDYIEIIISYAVLYFILQNNFSGSFCSVCQSLYYSVTTATMIGSNDWQPIKPWGYVIFFSQIIFAVLFLTVVVQHIIGRKDK